MVQQRVFYNLQTISIKTAENCFLPQNLKKEINYQTSTQVVNSRELTMKEREAK